jgi:GrpB-like predicted nucleotidyltransferase (UPF0157 family)
MPIVESWPDKYLVTLTLKNVSASELPNTLDFMVKTFQATKLAMRRTDRRKLVALRKLECTYNARTDEYHPHFHVNVADADSARLLLLRWLERHPEADKWLYQSDIPFVRMGRRRLYFRATLLEYARQRLSNPRLGAK